MGPALPYLPVVRVRRADLLWAHGTACLHIVTRCTGLTPLVPLRYNGGVENPFAGVHAALFDLDGTLIETHIDFPLMKQEALAIAARYGVRDADLGGLDILAVVETARERLEAGGRADDGRRLRTEAFARLRDIEVTHCAAPVEIPGAAALLRGLRARGVAVAIVTRNCRPVSEQLVAAGHLDHDVLLTRDDVPRTKPDPEHLRAALRALGQGAEARPERRGVGVMVGDHWMDVRGGRAAGLRTVGVLRGRAPDAFAPEPPDLFVDQIADLLPHTEALR